MNLETSFGSELTEDFQQPSVLLGVARMRRIWTMVKGKMRRAEGGGEISWGRAAACDHYLAGVGAARKKVGISPSTFNPQELPSRRERPSGDVETTARTAGGEGSIEAIPSWLEISRLGPLAQLHNHSDLKRRRNMSTKGWNRDAEPSLPDMILRCKEIPHRRRWRCLTYWLRSPNYGQSKYPKPVWALL